MDTGFGPIQRGLWRTLLGNAFVSPPAGVLPFWRHQAGREFPTLQPFLQPTNRVARSFPCLAEMGCGYAHPVVRLPDGRALARSQDDLSECRAVRVTEADLVIHELHVGRFGAALCRVLGLEPVAHAAASEAAPAIWRVGTLPATRSPVYLALCPTDELLLRNIQGLQMACREPLILLTPTVWQRSEFVAAALQRERSVVLELMPILALEASGFRLITPVAPVLERFAAGCQPPAMALLPAPTAAPPSVAPPAPKYLLRHGMGVWKLIFDGQEAELKTGRAISLAAYLLYHPPLDGIHATDLGRLVFGQEVVQEASLGAENNASRRQLQQQALKWHAVLSHPVASEGEKAEAMAKLEEIAELVQVTGHKLESGADKQVRAMRRALDRFIQDLRQATDRNKNPHPTLRAFGEHLHRYLWLPSSRYQRHSRSRTRAGVAGQFTYERPAGIRWAD